MILRCTRAAGIGRHVLMPRHGCYIAHDTWKFSFTGSARFNYSRAPRNHHGNRQDVMNSFISRNCFLVNC